MDSDAAIHGIVFWKNIGKSMDHRRIEPPQFDGRQHRFVALHGCHASSRTRAARIDTEVFIVMFMRILVGWHPSLSGTN